MPSQKQYDAVVVGAGPNGLAAAIRLAEAGQRVLLVEAADEVGGSTRSDAATMPGYVHDIGAAILPLGFASPYLARLPLATHGLRWVFPAAPVAHPLDGGTAVVMERSVAATARGLGRDGAAYYALMAPLVRRWHQIAPSILRPWPSPRRPLALAQFGLRAIWPAALLAKVLFREQPARALMAGHAAHIMLPLDQPTTAAPALVLATLAHVTGWPFPAGGAQQLSRALAAHLRSLGGEIITGWRVGDLAELPPHRAALLDVTPRQLLQIAGARLPERYRRALGHYRYGAGVFKIEYAIAGELPWAARGCLRAGTVHLGGTLDEIAAGEREIAAGRIAECPFVLLAQQSLFDRSRAPAGNNTVWAYCHVPHGSTEDMTSRIEAQIERFAPGFQERILARTVRGPQALGAFNPNIIGGDINGGAQDIRQLYTRPVAALDPYATPTQGIYLCSSSTPPGGGVHGLCGFFAAESALRHSLH
ncbi:MAG: NAD(P)/FAD-dependent oxidoreductase [Chloroflexales bacterium]|nr:NAD(P)/FAD-dependent oxidoreductase [Chloroflexales bacterium]